MKDHGNYLDMAEQSKFENDKERYWRNCACVLESKTRNLNNDLFAARQELITQGLKMRELEIRLEASRREVSNTEEV